MIERKRLRWDFWDSTQRRIQFERPCWSNARTSNEASWFNISCGVGGAVVLMRFAKHGLSVQLYLDSSDAALNTARFEALHARKSEFEHAFGQDAAWDGGMETNVSTRPPLIRNERVTPNPHRHPANPTELEDLSRSVSARLEPRTDSRNGRTQRADNYRTNGVSGRTTTAAQ